VTTPTADLKQWKRFERVHRCGTNGTDGVVQNVKQRLISWIVRRRLFSSGRYYKWAEGSEHSASASDGDGENENENEDYDYDYDADEDEAVEAGAAKHT